MNQAEFRKTKLERVAGVSQLTPSKEKRKRGKRAYRPKKAENVARTRKIKNAYPEVITGWVKGVDEYPGTFKTLPWLD